MNTIEVRYCLSKIRATKFTTRVCASNQLPRSIRKPCIIIANTKPSWDSGEHWIAIFINDRKEGIYFDSFGRPPINNEHMIFLNHHCKSVLYNDKMLQHISSNVCGKYSLLILLYLANDGNLNDFLTLFTNNFKKNDIIIVKLFKLYF